MGVYASTWWGGLGGYSGLVALAAVVVMIPAYGPYLLIVIASIQDAPGLPNRLWYPAFAFVAGVVLLHYALPRVIHATRQGSFRPVLGSRHMWVVMLMGAVVIYGLVITLVRSYFGGYPISVRRPPFITGGLILTILAVGYVGAALIASDRDGTHKLVVTCLTAVGNAMLALVLQALLGIGVYRSVGGLESLHTSAQLTGLGGEALRLTGTYVTPDGFGFCIILLLVLVSAVKYARRGSLGVGWMAVFLIIGVTVSLATLSKNVLLFFVAAWTLFALCGWGLKRRLNLLVLSSPLVIVASTWLVLNIAQLMHVFRVQTGGAYRFSAWHAVVTNFGLWDWFIGTGLSYWPVFLQQYAKGGLASPHTAILFVPGTYGVLGVLAYAVFAVYLGYQARHRAAGSPLAQVMLVFVFVIGLASINLLLGHTPLSYLVWLAIGMMAAMRYLPGRRTRLASGKTIHS